MVASDSPATKVLQRITSLLARPATYRALQSVYRTPTQDLEYVTTERAFWARRSVYYWIAFLSNSLLVLCGLSGYMISSYRDSNHEPRNCVRFTIVAVYTVPALLVTSLLVSSTSSHSSFSQPRKLLSDTGAHIKLALFGAAMNALAFLFMDIYALVLDNPESRFGTKNDIRNSILHAIIFLASVSTISLLTSTWITYSQKQTSAFELPTTSLSPVATFWNDADDLSTPSEGQSVKSP